VLEDSDEGDAAFCETAVAFIEQRLHCGGQWGDAAELRCLELLDRSRAGGCLDDLVAHWECVATRASSCAGDGCPGPEDGQRVIDCIAGSAESGAGGA
jgi:hypothetical protein